MEIIKVCTDVGKKSENKLYSIYTSLNERTENVINQSTTPILNEGKGLEGLLLDVKNNKDFEKLLFANDINQNLLLELALLKDNFWENGKVLKVKFLGGNAYLQGKVMQYAKVWEKFANITFVETTGDAEIRVAFMQGKGSWSYVGTDCLSITDQNEPTMNYGWFDDKTSDFEFSRTITHEFGHALGCIHEHQSPAAKINWNLPVVYDYYWQTQGWGTDYVDRNVLAKYDQQYITNSDFDSRSIMLYAIPKEFTTDGFSVGWNAFLSPTDIEFISRCYPKQ